MHFVRFVGEVCEKTFYPFQRQFFLQKYVYTRRDHKEVLKTPLDIMSNLIYIYEPELQTHSMAARATSNATFIAKPTYALNRSALS